MADELAKLPVAQVASFYQRLADSVDARKGSVKVSLAAMLLRHWLENRDQSSTFEFEPPDHLKSNALTLDGLAYHRRVYLTEEQARITNAGSKWAGVIPRLQGKPGFQKWNRTLPLVLDYQSLIEVPLRWQLTGSDEEKDILYALHGFQLKTYVTVQVNSIPNSTNLSIIFMDFTAQAIDRYDWDYSEHLTVPNPDFDSKKAGAVVPKQDTVVIYHRNAQRLEDARLAAPFNLQTKRWRITDPKLAGPAVVDPEKKL